jgi:lipopolysaccharide transport system permease protein
MLLRAWRYRHFILSSIQTEFRARFIRSRLGGLWMIIHPLVQVAIFALVLAGMMGARLPGMTNNKFAYALYLLSGMLAWSLFSEVISRCLTLFIDNGNLLKKIVFPHVCLPLIVSGSALFNNLLLFLAIIVLFGLLGHVPGAQCVYPGCGTGRTSGITTWLLVHPHCLYSERRAGSLSPVPSREPHDHRRSELSECHAL